MDHDHDHNKLILHVDHHGPDPLTSLPTRKLINIGVSDCDCYTELERAEARTLAEQRPDYQAASAAFMRDLQAGSNN